MNIPLEIWRDISLHLPYNFLALSKELIKIYDESWFEKKVKMKYPNCRQNDWKFLYKRMEKSGYIFSINRSNHKIYYEQVPDINYNIVKIEGIALANISFFNRMVLTFDGNLYYFGGGRLKLLDDNVLDISDDSYIKKNEWYYITENIKCQLIFKDNDPFLSCLKGEYYLIAITKDKIYHYADNVIVTKCKDIAEMVYTNKIFIIRKTNGTVYKYDPITYKVEKLPIKSVNKIFKGCVRLTNGTIARIEYENSHYRKELLLIPIITPNNNLRGAMYYNGKLLILIDNDVYKVKGNNSLKLMCSDIKNISSGYFIQ